MLPWQLGLFVGWHSNVEKPGGNCLLCLIACYTTAFPLFHQSIGMQLTVPCTPGPCCTQSMTTVFRAVPWCSSTLSGWWRGPLWWSGSGRTAPLSKTLPLSPSDWSCPAMQEEGCSLLWCSVYQRWRCSSGTMTIEW